MPGPNTQDGSGGHSEIYSCTKLLHSNSRKLTIQAVSQLLRTGVFAGQLDFLCLCCPTGAWNLAAEQPHMNVIL